MSLSLSLEVSVALVADEKTRLVSEIRVETEVEDGKLEYLDPSAEHVVAVDSDR